MPIQHPKPRAKDITQVISLQGNQCAFETCDRPIVVRGQSTMEGEIAHIKARREGGPRFDPRQSPEENRSFENLIAACSGHADLIDDKRLVHTYTVERLQEMKRAQLDKVEQAADRSWIRYPNQTVSQVAMPDGSMQPLNIYWWVDRHGNPQIYTDRRRRIAQTLMQLYLDLDALCQLQELVADNPDAPGRSLKQDYATMKITGTNPKDGEPWKPIAHVLRTMAMVPEITFGEFVRYLVEGGDATGLLVEMEKELGSS